MGRRAGTGDTQRGRACRHRPWRLPWLPGCQQQAQRARLQQAGQPALRVLRPFLLLVLQQAGQRQPQAPCWDVCIALLQLGQRERVAVACSREGRTVWGNKEQLGAASRASVPWDPQTSGALFPKGAPVISTTLASLPGPRRART